MCVQRGRLLSLIDFSKQSVLLRSRTVPSVETHGLFALYEHEIEGMAGIRTNAQGAESDEIWLSVSRLHEGRPPAIDNALIQPWVQVVGGPDHEPTLRETVRGDSLIAAGTHCAVDDRPQQALPRIDPEAAVRLDGYDRRDQVRAEFAIYLDEWRRWSREEMPRRRTIRLYSKLFTLRQELEGALVEGQRELVWGAAVGVWRCGDTDVRYPLVARLVEISLNSETADIEVRPRGVDARAQLEWYASMNNPGVAMVEDVARDFLNEAERSFSPFDRGSFEAIARAAVAHLDEGGVYWPEQQPGADRTLPRPDDRLIVTDTWVLFSRPRSNNVFVQDLDRLRQLVENAEDFPGAVAAVVTDPAADNPAVELPAFRGLLGACPRGNQRELYFPKPYNADQVRIVQLLERSNGVVVQGPPGTGKTHTIANVICHFLAEGKRVLVTSMKDPALAVLREQLPEEIRPLAISLLTSEQEGTRQFEQSIERIAYRVQVLDRDAAQREINDITARIDAQHARLALIDRETDEWARRNLAPFQIDGDQIAPVEAAREVMQGAGEFDWLVDELGIGAEFAPRFTDDDVARLRDARRELGEDIEYLDGSLPDPEVVPESEELLEIHRNLCRAEQLRRQADAGEVPRLADRNEATLDRVGELACLVRQLDRLRTEVANERREWTIPMRRLLRCARDDRRIAELERLGGELLRALEREALFLQQPVQAPPEIDGDRVLVNEVNNRASGRRRPGLRLLFDRGRRRLLSDIRVLGHRPDNARDWQHVAAYLDFRARLRELALRWNALAAHLPLAPVAEDPPAGALRAVHEFELYRKVREGVLRESKVSAEAERLFPEWPGARAVVENAQRFHELDRGLQHLLEMRRLDDARVDRDRMLNRFEPHGGRAVDEIRQFLRNSLGNPRIEDAQVRAEWQLIVAKVGRLRGLAPNLATVREVSRRIEDSGAPIHAARLREPLVGPVDHLLPNDWRRAWRLRRLATHLASLDRHERLEELARERRRVEDDLAHDYRQTVVQRTWLKLAENATPVIRAALQAYRAAIMGIGRGLGRRAPRYRRDARQAAMRANPAVPCWIMPHYRVSESLPVELGCFDLVVIDEASQSDFTALPSLLRACKLLIVGDDKQVSPEGVGLEEEAVRNLMNQYLADQVADYRPMMSPERSMYDLLKVVFAANSVMLREHFRCVRPIIEYSKREFYNHELQPLRLPRRAERLDPPLVDVLVTDGFRQGEVNRPEARFIADEIRAIVGDPAMTARSIGVVSLLGDGQAQHVWDLLEEDIGPELIERHRITCGDARSFQGKERDIMFLSLVTAENQHGAALAGKMYEQRFNVAASRARDRMYLVRSVEVDQLTPGDRLRRRLIAHFDAPFGNDEQRVEDLRQLCESDFERAVYDELSGRGYRVIPQVRVGNHRIDLVVEGHNDARLAVECDGDRYHGPERWAADMQRQRVLERAGWAFWRCFASAFLRRRQEILEDLERVLTARGIEPIGAEGAPQSVHSEHRRVVAMEEPLNPDAPAVRAPAGPVREPDGRFARAPYVDCEPQHWDGPGLDNAPRVAEGLEHIVDIEGPMLADRAYRIYLEGCGRRRGRQIEAALDRALDLAILGGSVVLESEGGDPGPRGSIVRRAGSPRIRLRTRGSREFEDIPPSEVQAAARLLVADNHFACGSEDHIRAIMDWFEVRNLTAGRRRRVETILHGDFPHVREFLAGQPIEGDDPPDDTARRFRGALLGLACGDALGTTVEFRRRGTFAPVTDMVGGGPFDLQPGEWTDDTSMALCLAESLVECRGFDAADQMRRYVRWYREGHLSSNGRCFDIGGTTATALQAFERTGNPFSGGIHPQSAGNGCLMRLVPVPMFFHPDREAVVAMSGESSRTTHGAAECVEASRLFGAMLSAALGGAGKEQILFGHGLEDFTSPGIRSIAAGDYRAKREDAIVGDGYVVRSLEAALWCFLNTGSFREAILRAVNLGDDADTTAAICGQLAGAHYGENGIPDGWNERLACRELIRSLADRLRLANAARRADQR